KKRQLTDAGGLPSLLIYYQSNLICLLYALTEIALVSVSIFVIIIVTGVGFIGPARTAFVATVKIAVAVRLSAVTLAGTQLLGTALRVVSVVWLIIRVVGLHDIVP